MCHWAFKTSSPLGMEFQSLGTSDPGALSALSTPGPLPASPSPRNPLLILPASSLLRVLVMPGPQTSPSLPQDLSLTSPSLGTFPHSKQDGKEAEQLQDLALQLWLCGRGVRCQEGSSRTESKACHGPKGHTLRVDIAQSPLPISSRTSSLMYTSF